MPPVTDLAIRKRYPISREFIVSLRPDPTREQVQETFGWMMKFANRLQETTAPTMCDLRSPRDLKTRTDAVHKDRSAVAKRGYKDG